MSFPTAIRSHHAHFLSFLLLAAVAALISSCAPMTCCPQGPPYVPTCSEGFYYYFHGNQLQPSPLPLSMLSQSPWRHMGRVRKGSGTGTGVLIHPRFVLTAAHVVMNNFDTFPEYPPYFSLAQPCTGCLPYGTKSARRVWVPEEWIENIGGSYDSVETRAYDWALMEVELSPTLFSSGVPDPVPMPASNQVFSGFENLTPRAAGYPCGRQADGSDRRPARPYTTDGSASFLNGVLFPAVAGAQGGSLLRTSLEGTSGMSGGPVWVEQNGQALLVGVLIGSPQEACDAGENWAAGLSVTTRQRIMQVIADGSAPGMVSQGFMSGGGGFDECEGLSSPLGPCPFEVTMGGEENCANPERDD